MLNSYIFKKAPRHKTYVFIAMVAAIVPLSLVSLVIQPFVAPMNSDPPAVDPLRLQAHVKYLSQDLYPRSFDQFINTEHAVQYILEEFKAVGAKVTIQEVPVQESTYKNIIAGFGPSKGPLLVIGAHYDSFGDAIEGAMHPLGYSPQTHTPGADDNASGVAALIELARLLSESPPSRSVELVAYALEEPPYFRTQYMGSAVHAHSLTEEKRQVQLMLSLEMIGYYSDEQSSQRFPFPGMSLFYPDHGNFIALVGRLGDFQGMRTVKSLMSGATDLPVYSINAPQFIVGVDFSDHRNYWAEGYPAIMVTDTSFYRNSNYHRAGDTYDTLDYHRMAKVVQSLFTVIQRF